MAEGISARLKKDEARKFGLAVGAVFIGLGAFSWWRGHRVAPPIFLVIGALLFVFGAVLPTALVPVRRMWMGAAERSSRVTTPIFMGVVYFGLLTPIGLLRRWVWHSPLERRSDKESFWFVREGHTPKPEDMEHQF